MSSSRNQYPDSFPTVPPSLSTDNHGMRDYYTAQDHTAQRPGVHTLHDGITPYLGLRSRLSQVWINRWTVLLLLVLARTLIAISSLNSDLGTAEAKALSACTSVESMGSAVASMPHYMAQGTNELAAKGIEKAVNGLTEMLLMSITAVEAIVLFVINMLYGTYECLITFAVGGATKLAIGVAEDATKFLNDNIGKIGKEIKDDVGKFQDGLNGFLNGLNSIPSIFGAKTDPPKISIDGGLDKLNNLKLPDNIIKDLEKAKASIPNYDEVHNFTNNVIRFPFEELKKVIKTNLGPYKFDRSAFPVPQKEKLSFCSESNGIRDFFVNLYKLADTAKKIFIAVLLILAILVCIPIWIREYRRWNTLKERAKLVQNNSLDPMDVIYIASRPYTAGAGLKVSQNLASNKRQVLTRWFIAYITSTPALLVLSLALAGLFSCLCQYLLLQALKKEVPSLAGQVGAFADKVVTSLNQASVNWANGTNTAILSTNDKINKDVFGWVGTSTTAVNDTLNTFIKQSTDVLNKAFGGTPLEEPIKDVFKCLIGLKVDSVQKGLTWVHDNAHINFPLFPNDTFSAGASKALAATDENSGINSSGDSFLADPGSGAADKVTEAVVNLAGKLESGIRTEALISTAVLMVYVIVCVMGLGRALFLFCRPTKVRGEGGFSYAGDLDIAPVHEKHSRNLPSPPMNGQENGFARQSEAPAYSEKFAAFRNPMSRAEQDPDVKVGHGGLRDPPSYRDGHPPIVSEYGVFSDEKGGRF